MARDAGAGAVYLGYEEEPVGERRQALLSYAVNKLGGAPDWPPLDNIQFSAKCPLCSLNRLLVVQCYAPFDNSSYHRTLYVFACISPNCWTQSEGWLCVRSQLLDETYTSGSCTGEEASVAMPKVDSNVTWCSGADEWDENDNGDVANGNFMNIDNVQGLNNSIHRSSDEDEESNSLDVETVEQALGNLQMFDAHNANMSPVQGAVGAASAPAAAAELEGGDEPGLVTVETPTTPNHDLHALLHQTAELPVELRTRLASCALQFVPKYIYVEVESKNSAWQYGGDSVDELLNKYKRESGDGVEMAGAGDAGAGGGGAVGEEEQYEESLPLHGDRLFHAFVTRLRRNPAQILRYSRTAPPLLGAPLTTAASTPDSTAIPTKCLRCGARTICELQLLPNFAAALQIHGSIKQLEHIQFLSVLVFTCAESCWNQGDSLVKEAIIFQPEIF